MIKIEDSLRKLILRSQLIQKLLSDFKPAHSRNDILNMAKLFFVLFVRCEQKSGSGDFSQGMQSPVICEFQQLFLKY